MDSMQERLELADPAEKLVVVVDDDESMRDLLSQLVRREGFRVERASDGLQALEQARSLGPDLLVMDCTMPGLGGYEVARQLQMEELTMPVLLVTGRRIDRQCVELITQERNVRGFLEKPVRARLLAAALHRILKTRPAPAPSNGQPAWSAAASHF